jgi:hypothetical protein
MAMSMGDVADALVTEIGGDGRQPDRVAIEKATEDLYMVRVWYMDEEEYEAYQLSPEDT